MGFYTSTMAPLSDSMFDGSKEYTKVPLALKYTLHSLDYSEETKTNI